MDWLAITYFIGVASFFLVYMITPPKKYAKWLSDIFDDHQRHVINNLSPNFLVFFFFIGSFLWPVIILVVILENIFGEKK